SPLASPTPHLPSSPPIFRALGAQPPQQGLLGSQTPEAEPLVWVRADRLLEHSRQRLQRASVIVGAVGGAGYLDRGVEDDAVASAAFADREDRHHGHAGQAREGGGADRHREGDAEELDSERLATGARTIALQCDDLAVAQRAEQLDTERRIVGGE